jgi:hypothetical protein
MSTVVESSYTCNITRSKGRELVALQWVHLIWRDISIILPSVLIRKMVTDTNVFEYTFLISLQLSPPTKHSQEIWDEEYVLVQSTE